MAASRRYFMGSIIGFGCLSLLGANAGTATAHTGVSVPRHPMILSRLQERSLRDGSVIKVVRKWQVRFERGPEGISVKGVQIEVSVEAPPEISSIASIEKERSTDDIWPMMLNADGRITQAGRDVDAHDFVTALKRAEALIRNVARNSSGQTTRLQELNRLQNIGASMLDHLPEDLFFPSGLPQQSKRSVQLAGGMTGEFEIFYDTTLSSEGAWLSHASRRVTTRIGETQKHVLENWALTPA